MKIIGDEKSRDTVPLSRLYITYISVINTRAGHNFRCPLLSSLSAVPLVNGTTFKFQF
jgi:hypothetical protein